jgi:hypothetical protein
MCDFRTLILIFAAALGLRSGLAWAQAPAQIPAQVPAQAPAVDASQAPAQDAAQPIVMSEPPFRSRVFSEAIAYREFTAAPGNPYEKGWLIGVQFYVDHTPRTRLYWVTCAEDGTGAAPFLADGGHTIVVPYLSCSFAPYTRQAGDGLPSDFTNSVKPFMVFYDRYVQNGLDDDLRVYFLGFSRGVTYGFERSKWSVYASLTANVAGIRWIKYSNVDGFNGKNAFAFQPGAANPEAGAIYSGEKFTLAISAVGMQGHWSIAPAQADGLFSGWAREIEYYTKVRLDIGKVSLLTEYDWYRFTGAGMTGFNGLYVGLKVFSMDFFHRKKP